jgi:CBS domain containing-hemolysin-like protein
VAGGRTNRPPPDGERARTHRRFLWRRAGTDAQARRPRSDPAYERSDAAEQERVIVEALGDLRDMDVREVMTPRTDVVALTIPVTAEDVARAVRESGHSAYPVVNGGLDDVVGVLYVNDLFRSRRWRGGLFGPDGGRAQDELPFGAPEPAQAQAPPGGGQTPAHPHPSPRPSAAKTAEGRAPTDLSQIEISRRIRQAYVVPESRPILAALVEMRRHRRGFAVVVDEYGGVSGVLTVKDLLEPIVGELHDELDVDEEPSIVRIDSSRWLVDGQTNVDEVRERLEIDVPEGEYVTLGGFILDALGHIPHEGEIVHVDGWELTVQDMEKRRIAGVLVRRREDDATGRVPHAPVEGSAQPAPGEVAGPRSSPATTPDEAAPPGGGSGALG